MANAAPTPAIKPTSALKATSSAIATRIGLSSASRSVAPMMSKVRSTLCGPRPSEGSSKRTSLGRALVPVETFLGVTRPAEFARETGERTFAVIEKKPKAMFDSSTYGLPVTDPDGYRWVLATFKKLAPFS